MIAELLGQLEAPFTGEELFDHLSDIVFFIKGTRGEYLVVNQTLVLRCNVASKQELLGRTATEVLRPPLGEGFAEQDRQVLRTGQALVSQLELHVYPTRDVGWCLTTKLPLRRKDGSIAGLVGVSQDLRLPDSGGDEYEHIADVVAYADRNLAEAPSVERLAEVAGMSRYQLDRRMRRIFGLTTGQWLLQRRIDRAQRALRQTDSPIASIAMDVGYGDQSAFTRQFRRTTGMSPRDYRLAGRSED
ncbi:AraC family transcriptional regulator [Roseiconus nitratireducens]|uniref:AraC family transcriptional regulator n=2 Tax=Roseiconus nitratireducens TaxID=2605748 RepID=A0A5M6D6T1_9BACT|nr:AraC family transcriptional regulator [Roseiconus nitratireducens]